MPEELKPCPFCGKSDIRMDFYEDLYYAVCNEVDCCAEGPYSADRNAAIAAWNKRADHERVVKVLVDALKNQLKPHSIWCNGRGNGLCDCNAPLHNAPILAALKEAGIE